MDWLFLLGLMVIGFLFLAWLTRPLNRRLQRWMEAHRFWSELGASVVMIVWGGSIWYLLISYNNYSNPFAMAAATFFIGFGTFSVIRILRNRT